MVSGGCTALDSDFYCVAWLDAVETFDPATDSWSPGPAMLNARRAHQNTPLADDSVLVTGGDKNDASLLTAERFTQLGDGAACVAAAECTSGHCVQDRCCNAACAGPCESCLEVDHPSTGDGTCGFVTRGTDPKGSCKDSGALECGDNGLCDGNGSCQSYPTTDSCAAMPCASAEECASGFCVDGVCCDSACDSLCHACSKAKGSTKDGACTPVAAGTDPSDDCPNEGTTCTTVALCDGHGACGKANVVCVPYVCSGVVGCMTTCATNQDCAAGYGCADGACVEKAPTCADGIITTPDGKTTHCAPYGCNPDGTCKNDCQSVDDCAPLNACDTAGRCVAQGSASGGDDGCGCHEVGLDGALRGDDREGSHVPISAAVTAAAILIVSRRRRAGADRQGSNHYRRGDR
jgi:hypothetical protein